MREQQFYFKKKKAKISVASSPKKLSAVIRRRRGLLKVFPFFIFMLLSQTFSTKIRFCFYLQTLKERKKTPKIKQTHVFDSHLNSPDSAQFAVLIGHSPPQKINKVVKVRQKLHLSHCILIFNKNDSLLTQTINYSDLMFFY